MLSSLLAVVLKAIVNDWGGSGAEEGAGSFLYHLKIVLWVLSLSFKALL
jgi:hypothetical protein